MAHVARADIAWQLLARLASAVYWFHPLIWLAAWRMRVEREAACDDCVLNTGERPSRYARLLLQLSAELGSRGQSSPGTAVAMASARKMEQRILAV